ncbi:MAG: uracil-DNA glycosylase [Proteobacteria bacterium]|nr:uracil-DNA glycosylase [Pseudomonadota bacterium]
MVPVSRRLSCFLSLLRAPSGPLVFNPWIDHEPTTDVSRSAPRDRLERLHAHLNCIPRFLLIGEAPGYQGCKVSGVPFTSERLLLAGRIPRLTQPTARLSTRHIPWSEPSATIVWSTLHELGIADSTILWNAYPWHPHKPGRPQSNRTPTPAERAAGLPVLKVFLAAFPEARVFALGRHAESALMQLRESVTVLRHPAMGGAANFRQQLRRSLTPPRRPMNRPSGN